MNEVAAGGAGGQAAESRTSPRGPYCGSLFQFRAGEAQDLPWRRHVVRQPALEHALSAAENQTPAPARAFHDALPPRPPTLRGRSPFLSVSREVRQRAAAILGGVVDE